MYAQTYEFLELLFIDELSSSDVPRTEKKIGNRSVDCRTTSHIEFRKLID